MQMYSVDDHFEGKDPTVKEIYNRLVRSLKEFGPVQEVAKKTSIHLDHKSGFGGVHVRKSYINLVIRTNYQIDSSRLTQTEQVSKNRFHHTVKLETPDDIDEELLGWLKDAYQLSG
jgi:hypothetical protein